MPKSKKPEIDEVEKDPVVYFDPQRIPIEVWNQILKHISCQDLLSLSLVCKTFYKTIGILPEAMDKILLIFDFHENSNDLFTVFNQQTTFKDIIKSSRQFTCLSIQTNKIKKYFKILEKFGTYLRFMEFDFGCQLSEKDLVDTLELTQKNLRFLKIRAPHLKEPSTSKTFKMIALEKFDVMSYDFTKFKVLLDLLPNTLLEVSCYYVNDNERFINFLGNQKNLKHLVLKPNENSKLLKLIGDADIQFELEHLEIYLKECTNSCEKFDKFLKSQAEKKLKLLRLKNISFHQFNGAFEFMPKLETLEIACSKSEFFLQFRTGPMFCCPSLKTLIINYNYRRNFLENSSDWIKFFERFDGVQEIVFKMKVSPSNMEVIAEKFPDLKKMVFTKFVDYSFNSVSFEKLEELHIIHLYKGLEEIDLNLEESSLAMKNLKVLKIGEKVKVTATSLLWILVYFKNLQHLEIHCGFQLTDELLCNMAQFFKNLQFFGVNDTNERFVRFIECLKQYPDLKYAFPEDRTKYLAIEDYGHYFYNHEDDTDSEAVVEQFFANDDEDEIDGLW